MKIDKTNKSIRKSKPAKHVNKKRLLKAFGLLLGLMLIVAFGLFLIQQYNSTYPAEGIAGKAYSSLTSEQKQGYWVCYKEKDCGMLLSEAQKNKIYAAYRSCSKECYNAALAQKQEDFYCTDSDGINYTNKGTVTSNFYPNGKDDYCLDINGKSYLFEGKCVNNKAQFVQKNCGEMGSYKCEEGKCTLSNDPLKVVFGISQWSPLLPEDNCNDNLEGLLIEAYKEQNITLTIINETIENVSVKIFVPDPNGEKIKVADEGRIIIKSILPIMTKYFGSYPCQNLDVKSYQNYAAGSPGSIGIGGNGGINHPWLLGHEMTHSYFHTSMGPQWLAEGTATSMPFIYVTDILNNPPDFWMINTSGTNYNIEDDYIYNKPDDINWDKPICLLEDDYIASSYAGRFLIEELYLKIGKQNLLNSLRLIYDKYRHTNEKITYTDFCKSVLYYTPITQQNEIKEMLNYKWCNACEE